jgi:hypothetical protein
MTREVDDPASEFAKFEPFLVFEENIEHILQGAGLYAIHRRKRPLNLLNTLPNVLYIKTGGPFDPRFAD